jgi:hypothetical protein
MGKGGGGGGGNVITNGFRTSHSILLINPL